MKEKAIFVYLDFLGFSEWVKNHPTIEEGGKWFSDSQIRIGTIFLELGNIQNIVSYEPQKLTVLQYTDTIVICLYEKDINVENICELFRKVNMFMASSYKDLLPVRGAISYGEVGIVYGGKPSTQNESEHILQVTSIFGEPFLEAHFLAESLQLSAIAITESLLNYLTIYFKDVLESYTAIYRIEKKGKGKKVQTSKQRMLIPSKHDNFTNSNLSQLDIIKSFKRAAKGNDRIPDSVKRKLKNTLKFNRGLI